MTMNEASDTRRAYALSDALVRALSAPDWTEDGSGDGLHVAWVDSDDDAHRMTIGYLDTPEAHAARERAWRSIREAGVHVQFCRDQRGPQLVLFSSYIV